MYTVSKSLHVAGAERNPIDFSNSLIDGAHVSAISQSRDRCRALGLRDSDRPEHSPISRSDFTIARDRSMRLFRHAAPIMEILYEQIINTHSMVVLTDDQGTILHGIGDNDFLAKAEKVALLPGVNWAENKKGTNGMGTALMDERPTLVHAGEHYLSANHCLTCSAAPIFDPRGDLLGVLDVTSDHRSYHQHTMGLVKMTARMIENDWFNDNFRESLRLYIHPRAEYLGTLMQGILAISRDGRILGANRCAVELLGMSPASLRMHSLTSLLGTGLGGVVDHARLATGTNYQPMSLSTTNGLMLYARAELTWAPVLTAGETTKYKDDSDHHDDFAMSDKPDKPNKREALEDQIAALNAKQTAESASTPAPRMQVPTLASLTARRTSALSALNTGDTTMSSLLDKTQRVLNKNIPVLILGETGTGKEWLARALHADSARADLPFIAVNCASIPDTLIESELFGYEEGALTGARKKGALGKILQANGGTLFLDEIGDMPLPLQAHLLRVLQERQVTPLGGKPVAVDVTLICATHRDLRAMLEKQTFREDLYYRLNGLTVRMPALRQRSDLAVLIQQMLAHQHGADSAGSRHKITVSEEVMRLFGSYGWPGNLRQLSNMLRTASVMAGEGGVVTVDHLPDDFIEEISRMDNTMASALNIQGATHAMAAAQAGAAGTALAGSGLPLSTKTQTLEELELATIRAALEAANGNISVASKKLGISRNTIYRKLKWNGLAANSNSSAH
jgi:sigma-54 dependent transcriptional regulator, acetoin dehydrogenase operon transcriptional activator AcoR